MKNKIVLFLLLVSSLAFGQVPRVFTGKCNISQTGSGAGYWQVGVTNFDSPGGVYDAGDITVNDKLYFNDSGILYTLNITTIVSASGTNATIRVSNVGVTGISSVPTSGAEISRGTANYKFVPWTANMTDNDNQIVNEHSWYLADSLLAIQAAKGNITQGTLVAASASRTVPMGGQDLTFDNASNIRLRASGEYYIGNGSGDLPTLNSDDTNFDLGLGASNELVLSQKAADQVLSKAGAPVDGTDVAWYVGQLLVNSVTGDIYRASSKSTNPDFDGTGSVWAAVSTGGGGAGALPSAISVTANEKLILTDSSVTFQIITNQLRDSTIFSAATYLDIYNISTGLKVGDRVFIKTTGAQYLVQTDSIVSKTVDGVVQIRLPSGGVAVLQPDLGKSYNLRHLGAVGNGVTDDTDELRKGVQTYGFSIHGNEGENYLVNTSTSIAVQGGQTIDGRGAMISFASSATTKTIFEASGYADSNMVWRNWKFYGISSHKLNIARADSVLIVNNYRPISVTDAYNVVVENCKFYGNDSGVKFTASADSITGRNARVSNCEFYNCANSILVFKIDNVTIENCYSDRKNLTQAQTFSHHIYCSHATNVKLLNCHLTKGTGFGLKISTESSHQNTCEGLVFTNVTFDSLPPIWIGGASNLAFNSCYFIDALNGILQGSAGTTDISMAGCTIDNGIELLATNAIFDRVAISGLTSHGFIKITVNKVNNCTISNSVFYNPFGRIGDAGDVAFIRSTSADLTTVFKVSNVTIITDTLQADKASYVRIDGGTYNKARVVFENVDFIENDFSNSITRVDFGSTASTVYTDYSRCRSNIPQWSLSSQNGKVLLNNCKELDGDLHVEEFRINTSASRTIESERFLNVTATSVTLTIDSVNAKIGRDITVFPHSTGTTITTNNSKNINGAASISISSPRTFYYNGTQWLSTMNLVTGDIPDLSSTYFKQGGNSFGSTANLGTNDAFGLNVETNNIPRLRLNDAGRLFSGTLTDVNLVASDSIYFSGGSYVDFVGSGNMNFTGLVNQTFIAGDTWSATASDSASLIASNFNRIGTSNDKILFNESTDVISVQPDGVVTAEFAGPSLTTFTSQTVRLDAYASGTAPALALREDDANGTNEISLKSPATLGADYTQTLTAATGEIPVVIKGSGSLNFSSTTGGTCQDLTLSVTGVTDGDVVSLGIPIAAITTNGQFTAFVSGTNTVNVRFCTAVTEDPGSGTFKVSIQK